MAGAAKWVIGGSAVLILAVGGELLWIHHRNAADQVVAPTAASTYKMDPDDEVYVKQDHPMSLKDEKDLKGTTIWVSAGAPDGLLPLRPRQNRLQERRRPARSRTHRR